MIQCGVVIKEEEKEMDFVNSVLLKIWEDRYRKNGESLEENYRRVAKFCASNETEENDFYHVMENRLFFPAGRTMSNSGIGKDLTLNNCFVAPQIKDSLEDIFSKVKLGAMTHQKGGGIGYDFSQLRPKGAPTANDAIASGAVSFMDCFNAQTATILQGNRRGANMGVMSVYNMDIEEFIAAKSYEAGKLNHFNVSVMVDNAFISAARNNETIHLHHPVYDEEGKILQDPTQWRYSKEIDAAYLWNMMIKKAYENGEPGIFFYDNLNKDNNLWYIENIVCTNPCAEYLAGTIHGVNPKTGETLDPNQYGGACNLGSLFLHNFVKNPFTATAKVDFDLLKKTIGVAVRFLDNIIDINNFPDAIYENYQKAFRTIGLGVTGLADMLAMMGFRYHSAEAHAFADKLMNFIALNAYRTSILLAKEKGAFPFLDREKFIQGGYLQKHSAKYPEWKKVLQDIEAHGIRNGKILSVAPTGTLSLTYGNNCSSGIEPIFSLSYDRKVCIGGQEEKDIQVVKMEDFAYHLWQQTKETAVVKEDVFVTALEMSVEDHIDMLKQIAWHVDMSVSKTINVPTEYSFEDTRDIYNKCHECGIKGCTIFRPNAIRQGILLTEKKQPQKTAYNTIVPVSRKLIGTTHGNTYCKKCACGTLYITINRDDDGNTVECFVHTSKGGICQANISAVNRLVSLAMRSGVKTAEIVDQLKSINCPACVKEKTKGESIDGMSCPDIIAKTISDFVHLNENGIEQGEEENTVQCPDCGEMLRFEGGCVICLNCGWSKCQ